MFYLAERFLGEPFEYLALAERGAYGVGRYVVAGVSGWALHILLDAPLYHKIMPLYPLTVNPFYDPDLSLVIMGFCTLSLFAGSLLYLNRLYCSLLNRADSRVAGACSGLIAIVLGLATVISFWLPYTLISVGLVFWGLLTFYNSLKSLEPSAKTLLTVSEAMMLTAAILLLILMSRVFFLQLGLEQFLSGLFSSASVILLFSSWLASLISIVLLRPVLHRLGPGDRFFKLLVDLLVCGWFSTPLLVGIPVVAVVLVFLLFKTPSVLIQSYTRSAS